MQWRVRPPVVSCDHRPAIARPVPRRVNRASVDPRRARARLLNVRTEPGGTAVPPEKGRASARAMVLGTALDAAWTFGEPRCRAGARDGSTARRSLVPQPKYSSFRCRSNDRGSAAAVDARMMPQRPTAVGCNRRLGRSFASLVRFCQQHNGHRTEVQRIRHQVRGDVYGCRPLTVTSGPVPCSWKSGFQCRTERREVRL